jgi:hypothetical protein
MVVRSTAGKHTNPTAGIIDSQSVMVADQAGERGFDAGKKIRGGKRHLLVDICGLVLAVAVTPAAVPNRAGARLLLSFLSHCSGRLRVICTNGGYTGTLIEWLWQLRSQRRIRLEIVNRLTDQRGFQIGHQADAVEFIQGNRRQLSVTELKGEGFTEETAQRADGCFASPSSLQFLQHSLDHV